MSTEGTTKMIVVSFLKDKNFFSPFQSPLSSTESVERQCNYAA